MSGRESGAFHSNVEAGELDRRTPRSEGDACFNWTVGGKHGGCIGTRGRVHETTTDSGSQRLKRGAVCVNCARHGFVGGAWVGDHPGAYPAEPKKDFLASMYPKSVPDTLSALPVIVVS